MAKQLRKQKADKSRPSLIKVNTLIGHGCPAKQGKASAHGEPLGEENVAALKENIKWPCKGDFEVPQEVYDHYKELAAQGAKAEEAWNKLFDEYCTKYPEMKRKSRIIIIMAMICLVYLIRRNIGIRVIKPEATRNISGVVLNMIKKSMPNLIGGSADLAPSNKTNMKDAGDFQRMIIQEAIFILV